MTELASAGPATPTARVLDDWERTDVARGLHSADREVVRSTAAARSLVLELLSSSAPPRDLFNACARLGGLMAEGGASPSLAAGVIDSAVRALEEAGISLDERRVPPARASVVEGYVGVLRERERGTALSSWDYPACVVAIAEGEVAVACGHPPDDPEALAAWASHVTGKLVKTKIRRVRLGGSAPAMDEMANALSLVGIAVLPTSAPTPAAAPAPTRRWFRLPWQR